MNEVDLKSKELMRSELHRGLKEAGVTSIACKSGSMVATMGNCMYGLSLDASALTVYVMTGHGCTPEKANDMMKAIRSGTLFIDVLREELDKLRAEQDKEDEAEKAAAAKTEAEPWDSEKALDDAKFDQDMLDDYVDRMTIEQATKRRKERQARAAEKAAKL